MKNLLHNQQSAKSYHEPRSLDGYRKQFGYSNFSFRKGYLEIISISLREELKDQQWTRYYVVIQEGNILIHDSEKNHLPGKKLISLNEVKYVRSINWMGDGLIIALSSTKMSHYLRAESLENMNNWLFSLHKAIIKELIDENSFDDNLFGIKLPNDRSNSCGNSILFPRKRTLTADFIKKIDKIKNNGLLKSNHHSIIQNVDPYLENIEKKELPFSLFSEEIDLNPSVATNIKKNYTRFFSPADFMVSSTINDSGAFIDTCNPPSNQESASLDTLQNKSSFLENYSSNSPKLFSIADEVKNQQDFSEDILNSTNVYHESKNSQFNLISTFENKNDDSKKELFGICSVKGHRPTMEDYHIVLPDLEQGLGMYGIFDGHCGKRAAQMISERLPAFCIGNKLMAENWPNGTQAVINQAFLKIQEDFIKMSTLAAQPFLDGSCAIVLIVQYRTCGVYDLIGEISIANLGDSRAVLFDGGRIYQLSEDHTPSNPKERKRIEAAGGWITVEKEMVVEKLHRMDLQDRMIREHAKKSFHIIEISRLNGELSVSRALGDLDYKKPGQDSYSWYFPRGHPGRESKQYTFNDDLVSSTPEWQFYELEKVRHGQDNRSFVVLACDGLWDSLSNEEVIEICFTSDSPSQASERLVDAALRLGSMDNISVIVIPLRPNSFVPVSME